MKKNILILLGSPRVGGNSDQMADAFARGAEAAGHVVNKIYARDLNVFGCEACNGCYQMENMPCCHGDDFNKVAPMVEQADVVVFAAPLYWYTFPTQLKRVIDNFYAFYCGKREIQGKRAVLLSCGEDSRYTMFDGIQRTYELMMPILGWSNAGMVLVPGVNEVGDILETDALKQCEQLGKTM